MLGSILERTRRVMGVKDEGETEELLPRLPGVQTIVAMVIRTITSEVLGCVFSTSEEWLRGQVNAPRKAQAQPKRHDLLLRALVVRVSPRSCWHLGCILPRVPATIVRTGDPPLPPALARSARGCQDRSG